jgi:hypothetical protein
MRTPGKLISGKYYKKNRIRKLFRKMKLKAACKITSTTFNYLLICNKKNLPGFYGQEGFK